MKGKGNLHYYFEVHQRTEDEIRQRTREIAEIMGVGFDVLLGQKTDTLSGGEQQRVAIARCIVRDPLIFLLDEPISNLDAKLRERTRLEIKKLLRKFKVTTLYVTHDQGEAIFMGDRIAVMRKGRIEQVGTFDDLYFSPANAFVASFIGTPPMHFIPAEAEHGILFIKGGSTVIIDGKLRTAGDTRFRLPATIAEALAGAGSVRMGMRAESWQIVPQAEGVAPLMVSRIERIQTEQAAFVHGTVGGVPVIALAPLDQPQAEVLYLRPDWEKTYFFNQGDEGVLYTPGAPDLF
jgi:ABC-type sugar transport system ATPase subunit